MSERARNRYEEAKPVRDQLREEVAECEICGRTRVGLDVHEICRGVDRQKALDKRFALLLVCRPCHEELGSAREWPQRRQLAVLAQSRLPDFDLPAFLHLTNPNAPRRIELEEILEFMPDQFLSVTEIADRMNVNRRSVQSWIDKWVETGGEDGLPATDARAEGSNRPLWRVEWSDLLEFLQKRKHGNPPPHPGDASVHDHLNTAK